MDNRTAASAAASRAVIAGRTKRSKTTSATPSPRASDAGVPSGEPAPGAYPDSGPFMRMILGFAALALVERLPRALARRLRPRIGAAVQARR